MIVLDFSDKRPIYEQVTEKYKELIARGILPANEQLPSVRTLAMELSINPNTIQRAYMELERAGFIYAVKGRGNFVADITAMLPQRQAKFYEELDSVLQKADGYSLSSEDVVDHVEKFYRKANSGNNDKLHKITSEINSGENDEKEKGDKS